MSGLTSPLKHHNVTPLHTEKPGLCVDSVLVPLSTLNELSTKTKETAPSLRSVRNHSVTSISHNYNQVFLADLDPELVSASTIDAFLLSRGGMKPLLAL